MDKVPPALAEVRRRRTRPADLLPVAQGRHRRVAGEQAQPRAHVVSHPDVTVRLVIGCQPYDIGTITADPEHWREGLAGLLRGCAAEIVAETPEDPCPADG